jgi:hypothetical protein
MKLLVTILIALAAYADDRVNADAQITADFTKRVGDYQQLEKTLEDKLTKLKSTGSERTIQDHEHALAKAIREARKDAKAGDIFTPPICVEFRRLTGLAMVGNNTARVHKSLQDSEPVQMQLKVGDSYPTGVPEQSTPPTLLLNLPPLPPNLAYRLLGTTLILLDAKANIVVDLMPDAIH